MKILITENQYEAVVSKLMEKYKITKTLLYWQDNGKDSITGTVYLYKNDEVLGYRYGYEFYYYYDWISKSLTYKAHGPNIENVDVFRFLPSEVVVNYFSDKMKTYLENQIKKGYTNIRVRN